MKKGLRELRLNDCLCVINSVLPFCFSRASLEDAEHGIHSLETKLEKVGQSSSNYYIDLTFGI